LLQRAGWVTGHCSSGLRSWGYPDRVFRWLAGPGPAGSAQRGRARSAAVPSGALLAGAARRVRLCSVVFFGAGLGPAFRPLTCPWSGPGARILGTVGSGMRQRRIGSVLFFFGRASVRRFFNWSVLLLSSGLAGPGDPGLPGLQRRSIGSLLCITRARGPDCEGCRVASSVARSASLVRALFLLAWGFRFSSPDCVGSVTTSVRARTAARAGMRSPSWGPSLGPRPTHWAARLCRVMFFGIVYAMYPWYSVARAAFFVYLV